MYPWWLLQLHVPAAHFQEPLVTALLAGNQAQVPQDQPATTSYILRPLYPEMNLILCHNNNVSSLWYPKTGTEPHLKTST